MGGLEKWTVAPKPIVQTGFPIRAAHTHPNPRLNTPTSLSNQQHSYKSLPPLSSTLCNCTERGLLSSEAKRGALTGSDQNGEVGTLGNRFCCHFISEAHRRDCITPFFLLLSWIFVRARAEQDGLLWLCLLCWRKASSGAQWGLDLTPRCCSPRAGLAGWTGWSVPEMCAFCTGLLWTGQGSSITRERNVQCLDHYMWCWKAVIVGRQNNRCDCK